MKSFHKQLHELTQTDDFKNPSTHQVTLFKHEVEGLIHEYYQLKQQQKEQS